MNDETTATKQSGEREDTQSGPIGTGLEGERRTRRRELVKGAVVVTGGIVAADYVSPSLTRLGVPVALAASPTIIDKCSINVRLTQVQCTTYTSNETIAGRITVSNRSGTGVCPVASIDVYAQSGSLGQYGGCGKDTSTNQVGHVSGSSGGTKPITVGTYLPSPDITYWTFSISTNNYVGPVVITVEITLTDQPQHNPNFFFKACASASC